MSASKPSKLNGYLFLTAGASFFIAGVIRGQPALFGIGGGFVAIGGGVLYQAGKNS